VSPTVTLDATCADAVPLARASAIEDAGEGRVGEHLGVQADGDRVATHFFACLDRAYAGWRWAVTVMRAARARQVTVAEVVLLPGETALLAPPWIPWQQRLRPGDLRVGDVLPTPSDDPRLVPAAFAAEDDDQAEVAAEFGLGRVRVIGAEGREEAADRWYYGGSGPQAPIARAAPLPCGSCGFYLRLSGPLRVLFGVCGNAYAPDDGRVVSADHGCGAHSEVTVADGGSGAPPPLVDEYGYDTVTVPTRETQSSVSDSDPPEPLGFS
jgi:hypothetical protein